jgi:hypothetical protein
MKDLLRKCPHHDVPKWQVVQFFYDELTEPHRQMVDSSYGGTFMLNSENEAWTLFENLGENSIQHASSSRWTHATKALKDEGMYAMSKPIEVTIKLDALSRKLDQLMAVGFAPTLAPPTHIQHEACAFCSHPFHYANNCPTGYQFSDTSHE